MTGLKEETARFPKRWEHVRLPVCIGVAHVPGGAGQDEGGGLIPVCRAGPEPWGGVGVEFQ